MKNLNRFFLFVLLIAFIMGYQPAHANKFNSIKEIANTLFYSSFQESRSISIYYVIDDSNIQGVKYAVNLALIIDNLLKNSYKSGFNDKLAYKYYRDAEIFFRNDYLFCYIKHNDKYKWKKRFYYYDNPEKVAIDIIVKILSEEI